MRCDWNLAETQFGIVLGYFRLDAIGIWLRQKLELYLELFRLDAMGIWLRHNLELS